MLTPGEGAPPLRAMEPAVTWAAALRAFAGHLLLVGLAVLVIGEVWFRLPWTTKIMIYEFDEERLYRFVPGQSRGLGLANFSVVSPPISINSDGFRNAEIDWSTPMVLALGSSQVLGQGVEDHEVWTAILAERVSSAAGRPITIVNAGVTAYGPYYQAVTVRQYLERYPRPSLVVVRAAVADRAFTRPAQRDLDGMRRHFAVSSCVRRYSEFLPFLVNRVEAQMAAIQNTFTPGGQDARQIATDEAPALADEMWRSEAQYWREIVDLATSHEIPVLFFVDGADGAPSAVRLSKLLANEFRHRSDVAVALFGARETGLDTSNDEVRRRQYHEQFVLGYDPHANARQHRLIAEFLTPLVAARGTWRSEPQRDATVQAGGVDDTRCHVPAGSVEQPHVTPATATQRRVR